MTLDPLRAFCSTLPGATMDVKWGADEVYSVGGKMFAVFRIDGGRARHLSFKCDPARFLELTDLPGVVPAPYLARAHWVQVKDPKALPRAQLDALVADSHARVLAKLPRRAQAAVAGAAVPATLNAAKPRRAAAARTR